MKKHIFIAVAFISTLAFSQQTPQSNIYAFNKYSFNPAYAGASGCTEINFSHMNQWIKVDGAPLTSYLGANTRIGKNIGIGGQLLVDQIGIMNQAGGLASFSYGLNFGNNHLVRIGLSAGYNQYRVDPSNSIAFDPNDPIVDGGLQSSGTVNSEIGILYQWKALELALGSKQIIQSYTNFGYNGLDGYGLRRHINLYTSYAIPINQNITLKPSIFGKGTNAGFQGDFNADVNYKNFIYGGIGYRTQVGVVVRAGINVQDLFFIGYGYETPMSNIASYSSGSHEVVMGLKFCKKEKKKKTDLADQNLVKKDSTDIIEDSLESNIVNDSLNITKNVNVTVDTVYISKVDTIYITKQDNSQPEIKNNLALVNKVVLFEFDKALIQRNSFGELESLVNIMYAKPNIKIELSGHTDSYGSDGYNKLLSNNRTNAIKDFLLSSGIDPSRIITKSFGESSPKESNSTAQGRKVNRRVEIRFIE